MSEEILRALIELFAILTRQGGQVSEQKLNYFRFFLQGMVFDTEVQKYYGEFVDHLEVGNKKPSKEGYKTSPIDSVDILAICYRINATLKQDQKVIVLLRCMELFKEDDPLSERDEILATCADVFKIPNREYTSLKQYVEANSASYHSDDTLTICDERSLSGRNIHRALIRKLNTSLLVVIHVPSVNLYFVRIFGSKRIMLNGVVMNRENIYILPPGTIIKIPSDVPVYYSDVVQSFRQTVTWEKIKFEAENISLQFPNGAVGIHPMNFSEGEGKLVGILGGSGSGKTTLLTVFSGLTEPTEGKVTLNGRDIADTRTKDLIGYVSQDDLLVEDLTVFQNLYYNARLIFGHLSYLKIVAKVNDVLRQLGLYEVRDLKVGSIHQKVLSGGQRKRLNMGLEMIRNPMVLFLDEPTSGLSSKDSENVMLLLSELRQKGHLLFVVIHQPSSQLYKLFDKVILMDQGGYCVYTGNPIEALSYFKSRGNKLSKDVTHCSVCGNVNAQEIFDIIEEKVINEYGLETYVRKVSPENWYLLFFGNIQMTNSSIHPAETVKEAGERSLVKPGKIKQWITYLQRDVYSKIANVPYLILLVLEPMILSFILSFVIRRATDTEGHEYMLMKNENIPAYIFMSIIVMIFIGLSMSAEEIFNDRKMLKREHFLGLSRMSYLMSKVTVLSVLTAFQSLVFVYTGNSILGIEDNMAVYWIMIFTVAFNSNLIGLNISSTFKSAVAIYILIPLLLIPQMILGGAMFSYEKLNRYFEDPGYAPSFVALIPSRWAYEGIMVEQFMSNKYEKIFYEHDKNISHYTYKNGPYLSSLYELIDRTLSLKDDATGQKIYQHNIRLIRSELERETAAVEGIEMIELPDDLENSFNEKHALKMKDLLNEISGYYQFMYNDERLKKDIAINNFIRNAGNPEALDDLKGDHHNLKIEMLVKGSFLSTSVVEKNGKLERVYEPVFNVMETPANGFRKYPFFSPVKHIFGLKIHTFWYNLLIIWLLNISFFVILYYDILKQLLRISNSLFT